MAAGEWLRKLYPRTTWRMDLHPYASPYATQLFVRALRVSKFGGRAPEFLDLIYNFVSVSDHVAKFRGDRPRELGDYALKKRNITGKTEDLPYYRTGGLIRLGSSMSAARNIINLIQGEHYILCTV